MGVIELQIISGGQTGADRAGLDWAIAHNVPHGGWCPKGRKAEDGPIDLRYNLRETPRADYLQRTEWNVRDTDGTVIFSVSATLSGGSKRTAELAQKHGKPCLHLSSQSDGDKAPELLRKFIEQHAIKVLNVAGPRGSKEPDVASFVTATLTKALCHMKHLEPPDLQYLEAAQGWLGLGNPHEANEELERITPQNRTHPDVLEVRWHIYAHTEKWEACVDIAKTIVELAPDRPDGWIHRSFALHELDQTQEAFDQLLPAAKKFRKVWTIPYNLACYCAQLGRLDQSAAWFKKAMAIDEHTVKKLAIDDTDLKPLWDSMGGTHWKRS